jgi:hypothetical protein
MATNLDKYVDEQAKSGITLGQKVRVKTTKQIGEVTGITEVFGVNVVFHDEGLEQTYKFYELERV